jgi:hypothetical protein
MVRAEVFDTTGYLDERLPCWQDTDWYFRLAPHYDYESIPDPLTVRRFTASPQISDRFESRRDVAYPLLLEKHRDVAATLGREGERTFLATMARAVAVAALKNQQYRDAVRFFLRSLRHRPTVLDLAYLFVASGGKFTHRPAQVGKRLVNRHLLDATEFEGFERPGVNEFEPSATGDGGGSNPSLHGAADCREVLLDRDVSIPAQEEQEARVGDDPDDDEDGERHG